LGKDGLIVGDRWIFTWVAEFDLRLKMVIWDRQMMYCGWAGCLMNR